MSVLSPSMPSNVCSLACQVEYHGVHAADVRVVPRWSGWTSTCGPKDTLFWDIAVHKMLFFSDSLALQFPLQCSAVWGRGCSIKAGGVLCNTLGVQCCGGGSGGVP